MNRDRLRERFGKVSTTSPREFIVAVTEATKETLLLHKDSSWADTVEDVAEVIADDLEILAAWVRSEAKGDL